MDVDEDYRECTRCRDWVPLSGFRMVTTRHGKQVPRSHCRDCEAAYSSDWGKRNPGRERPPGESTNSPKRVKRRRDSIRQMIWDYKAEVGCAGRLSEPCPYSEHDPRVLEFDHADGSCKLDNVSTLVGQGQGIARILAEMAKCEVRCANCHVVITGQRGGYYNF